MEAIKELVNQVKKHEKGTLIYDAYQEDNISFTHLMCFKDEKSEEIHRNSSYVKKFVSVLYPNCEKEPVFIELRKI